jgi:hypothetical protein
MFSLGLVRFILILILMNLGLTLVSLILVWVL